MPDYKSMYYHLAGRMATSVEVLEATVEMMQGSIDAARAAVDALEINKSALAALTEKIKLAQQATEDMFISGSDIESREESK